MTDIFSQFDHPFVATARKGKNYEIAYNEAADQKTCTVYFSSNAVYYPNTAEAFEYSILNADYYEWRKNTVLRSAKNIFVRDVYKQWYLAGINDEINSIEKLAEFIREETKQFSEIICIGCSSGGYAATLIGKMIGAHAIYTFSPQFSLEDLIASDELKISNRIVSDCVKMPESLKFMDISWITKENTESHIFYFYPALCAIDILQRNKVSPNAMLHIFPVKSKKHGMGFYYSSSVKIIQMKLNDLKTHLYEHRMNIPLWFFLKTSSNKEIYYFLKTLSLQLLKMIRKKIRL